MAHQYRLAMHRILGENGQDQVEYALLLCLLALALVGGTSLLGASINVFYLRATDSLAAIARLLGA